MCGSQAKDGGAGSGHGPNHVQSHLLGDVVRTGFFLLDHFSGIALGDDQGLDALGAV